MVAAEVGVSLPWGLLSASGTLAAIVDGTTSKAVIAQLGERQTEDLEVPSSILGHGIL